MSRTTQEIVESIRNAKTIDEAVDAFIRATTPKKETNKPPTIDEVLAFARDRASKDGEDVSYYLLQAEKAFDFYESNMEVMEARTWKDGNGRPVKNWKLKIYNNWLKAS